MERSRMCFNFMYKKYFLRMLLQGFKKYDDARLINAFFKKLLNVAKYQMVTANAIR